MMHGLLTPILTTESYQRLHHALAVGQTPALATGVVDTQKWHLAAALAQAQGRPVLAVTASELKAKEVTADLSFFYPDQVFLYPARDIIFYAADVKSADITRRRFAIVERLLEGLPTVVVVSVEALLDRLAPPAAFLAHILRLKTGDRIDLDQLTRQLTMLGYERVPMAEGAGQFALRGGILDISGAAQDDGAVRIEFFDDEIDSIRLLDTHTQRSAGVIDHAVIYPMRELVFDRPRLDAAIQQIEAEYAKTKSVFRSKNQRDEAQVLTDTIEDALSRLRGDTLGMNIESFFPFFYEEKINLLDYLPSDTLVFWDEPNRIAGHMETVLTEYEDSVTHRLQKGALLPSQAQMTLTYAALSQKLAAFDCCLYAAVAQTVRDFTVREHVVFAVKTCMPLRPTPDAMREDLSFWLQQKYRVVILAGRGLYGQRLADELTAVGDLPARFVPTLETADTPGGVPTDVASHPVSGLPEGMVTVTAGSLTAGFEYPACKLAVVTDKELITGGGKRRRSGRKGKDGAAIEHFTDLRVGDYVVHDNHGIGVYQGIEQIVTDGFCRDYLKLTYADGGSLYVHTGQMDMIQKYIGGQAQIKLNKLGGADWAKAKARARKSVQIMAQDLVDLYAKRQTALGYTYGVDTVWQSEFEAQFPYTETEDQLAAVEDVKRDMETGKIMDRLVCGDVGYGKTEIAIRAAFKTVQDNRQVAYLVPTTILAQQHYLTFAARLKDYPVSVERLSRFQTKKAQNATVERLANGQADIVIGTHRLLSKDVKFHNLGLIIVDEEQRFGVTHKEKLKSLKENVNVLTLTATPIPRTLHLSLTGLRDMSLLNEPPLERLPVQTYVMAYNPEFVRDAILRELARDGQVYYLHNRVRNIAEEAARVHALVPQAQIAFAHGQMSEHELERVMMRFVGGEVQVLVCTTIVETGLDIPNVNTIIIQNADYMGLSQLYQLRGRVGRSNRQAYAYLMYQKDKVLDEQAEKRLQTIREFTEFGAGFKIAMRDMEIRGAGNLLGAEQHGHMDSVGYDMYCKLLAEAVSEMRGEVVAPAFETTIDIAVDAYLPTHYIEDEMQKLEAYKRVSLIATVQDFNDVQETLEDRFGELPRPAQRLLDVALLKADAHRLGVVAIKQQSSGILIMFKPDASVDPDKLTALIKKDPLRLMFTAGPSPYLTFYPDKSESELVKALSVLLADLL